MKTSIQLKIIAIYLCVVLIIMIVTGTFIIYNIEALDYKSVQSQLEQTAQDLEVRLEIENAKTEQAWLDEIDSTLKEVINQNQIYILDETGKVLFGTSTEWRKGRTVASDAVTQAIATKQPAFSHIMHFAKWDRGIHYIDYVKPILTPDTSQIRMLICIRGNIDQIYTNMTQVMNTIVMGSIAAMIIAVLFGIVFSRMITVPIKRLTMSAKRLASGDAIGKIPVEANDEIGDLTKSFNFMANQLVHTMQEMSNEKSKLETIFEHMADGVMAFNRQGVLIHTNSICCEMIGEKNMDHRFDYIFGNLGVDISFDKLLEEKEKSRAESMVAVENKYFNMHFATYGNVKEEAEGLVVVMQDITKHQKLDQMRKEFVANVSHELRTPLTTVKSYTETLMDGAIDDKELAMNFLGVMDKEADRMTMLVHDLLELSRIDNKQIQLTVQKVDMKALVKETLEAQKIHIHKKGHVLKVEIEKDESYFIEGDGTRLKQILHNLLSNAIKYSIDPGMITVKMYKNEKVVIQIQDTGVGIPTQDLERVFERFYRVDKARSRKMGGTGLGLSIAKELIELQGGKIKMTSKVGKGTIVTLYFNPYKE